MAVEKLTIVTPQDAYSSAVIDSLPVNPWVVAVAVAKTPFDRSYSTRFKSVSAYENHKASARAYDKRKRDEATMKRNALRVNLFSDVGTAKQKQASDDKSRAIQASSYRYRTVR